MGRSLWNKHNWILTDGKWYNFHQYGYGDETVITIVRGPCRKLDSTRKIATKFVLARGSKYRAINKDELYKDEQKRFEEWQANWRPWMNVWRNQQ